MQCKCGCGTETSLAKRTDERYGTIEGQPLDFISGHQNTLRKLPKEEVLKRRRESRKSWRSRNPEHTRVERLKRLGWTKEGIASAKESQGGRCAICREVKELVPDHKHCIPPVPREMLCRACNMAIGILKESPESCEAAARYLRKHSA